MDHLAEIAPGFVRAASSAHPRRRGGWLGRGMRDGGACLLSFQSRLSISTDANSLPSLSEPLLMSLWCKFSRLYHMSSGGFRREKCSSKGGKKKATRKGIFLLLHYISPGKNKRGFLGSVLESDSGVCVEVGWIKSVVTPGNRF